MLRFPAGHARLATSTPSRGMALWKAGLDYAHGTGHGVGSYLSVHEGPQRIAKTGTEKLLAGMILSNEPGYYKEGHYGIRIENLIIVTPAEQMPGGDIAMHGFETLTLAPFDRRLLRTRPADPRRTALARRLSSRACCARSGRWSAARRWPGWKKATAPLPHDAEGLSMRTALGSADELPQHDQHAAPARNIASMPPRSDTSAGDEQAPPIRPARRDAAGATSVVSTAAGTAFSPASTRGWMRSKRDSTRWPPMRVR